MKFESEVLGATTAQVSSALLEWEINDGSSSINTPFLRDFEADPMF